MINTLVKNGILPIVLLLGIAVTSVAKEAPISKNNAQIVALLKETYPDLELKEVKMTAVDGVEEIIFVDGRSVFSLNGSKYFIKGELFRASDQGMISVRDERYQQERKEMLKTTKAEDMIIYAAEGKKKSEMTIFVDTDCGYCRKLHEEIPALNKMGVEVRYLAFPRAGLESGSFKDMNSIWCSPDRNAKIDKLFSYGTIPQRECKESPVAKQYNLARSAGIISTPAIVLSDGTLVMGYKPAEKFKQILGLEK